MSGPPAPRPHGEPTDNGDGDGDGGVTTASPRLAAPTVGTRAAAVKAGSATRDESPARAPTRAQRAWLARGLDQPGGKLPLFDRNGRRINARIVKACLDAGWAEPWFANPVKPDWQVCKLTEAGRTVVQETATGPKAAAPVSSDAKAPEYRPTK